MRRIAAVGLVAIVLAILVIFGVSPPMHYMEGQSTGGLGVPGGLP